MMASSSFNAMEEQSRDLSHCCVCTEPYDDGVHKPKFLSCSHTFCLSCIKVIVRAALSDTMSSDDDDDDDPDFYFKCPLCKSHIHHETGAETLPTNMWALHFFQLKKSTKIELFWCLTCSNIHKPACHEAKHNIINLMKDIEEIGSLFTQVTTFVGDALEKRDLVQKRLQLLMDHLQAQMDAVQEQMNENSESQFNLKATADSCQSLKNSSAAHQAAASVRKFLRNKIKDLKLEVDKVDALLNRVPASLPSPVFVDLAQTVATLAVSSSIYSPGNILSTSAVVQCCTSAMDVWIQLDTWASDELAKRISALVAQRESFSRLHTPTDLKLGEKCLAAFGLDWYRAVVESKMVGGRVGIRYIDYGNYNLVTQDKIKILPECLNEPEAMALKCALDGAEGKTLNVQQCQIALFHKALTVKVVKKTDEHLFVRLFDMNGLDINTSLNLPVARPVTMPINRGEEVYVSHVANPNKFFIQRGSLSVIEQIQRALGSVESDPAVSAPIVGELFAVKHPRFLQWYRARLDKLDHSNYMSYQVTFIDYGDVQKVPRFPCFRLLPQAIRLIPPLAHSCTFRQPMAVQPIDPETSEKLRSAFERCTESVACRAVISPDQGTNSDLRVDSLYAGTTDVMAMLKSGYTSPSCPVGRMACSPNTF